MDIERSQHRGELRRRRLSIIAAGAVVTVAAALGLSQLEPAAPIVERESIWIDTVQRGTMLRQVRAVGSLVPEQIVWIPAASESRVERILVQPGETVDAGTVLMVLNDPELEQQALAALHELRAAQAEERNLRVTLESRRLEQEAALIATEAEAEQAALRSDADALLASRNIGARLDTKISTSRSGELARRVSLERRRATIARESADAQLAVQRARIGQYRAEHELLRRKVDALHVRAGIAGVVQDLPVQVGQRVSLGVTLARIVQPTRLKAELKVPETQAKDVMLGQSVTIDTRNGLVAGRVARIAPSVQAGTVTIDVGLTSPLPSGARPDLSIDGMIEIERLDRVLHVGRPANGRESSTVGLFRLDRRGRTARRIPVELGRGSVERIEILRGLSEGDRLILSDMARFDNVERIEIRD